jgi:hypothetical protein
VAERNLDKWVVLSLKYGDDISAENMKHDLIIIVLTYLCALLGLSDF